MHTLTSILLLVLIAILAAAATVFVAGFLSGMALTGWLKKMLVYPRNRNLG